MKKNRRGASLTEMMVVIAIMSGVLSVVGVLFHRLFQAERMSTRFTLVELTTMRLADQFRRDVHAAQSANRATTPEGAHPVLELQSAAPSKVLYIVEPQRVRREVVDSTGTTSRELYRIPDCEAKFSEPPVAEQDTAPRFVSLTLARPHMKLTASPQAKPHLREVVIDAELGRDLRLAASAPDAPTTPERKEP